MFKRILRTFTFTGLVAVVLFSVLSQYWIYDVQAGWVGCSAGRDGLSPNSSADVLWRIGCWRYPPDLEYYSVRPFTLYDFLSLPGFRNMLKLDGLHWGTGSRLRIPWGWAILAWAFLTGIVWRTTRPGPNPATAFPVDIKK